jgi:hypothetical protein
MRSRAIDILSKLPCGAWIAATLRPAVHVMAGGTGTANWPPRVLRWLGTHTVNAQQNVDAAKQNVANMMRQKRDLAKIDALCRGV